MDTVSAKLRRDDMENNENDSCEVCELYNKKESELEDGVRCPKCGYLYPEYYCFVDFIVVGEDNSSNPEQKFNKFQTEKCPNCGCYFSLVPMEIIYNGNHDIYYTGSKYYLSRTDSEFIENEIGKALMEPIEQFRTRILNGELSLQSFHLNLWIKYKIEAVLASFLKSKGIKV